MRRRWPLNVDRLADRLCSSPMSANTAENGGRRTGGVAGTGRPAFAISTARPSACAGWKKSRSSMNREKRRTGVGS